MRFTKQQVRAAQEKAVSRHVFKHRLGNTVLVLLLMGAAFFGGTFTQRCVDVYQLIQDTLPKIQHLWG